ncbi:leucine-rich repeat domain-containing protein [Acanthopleuribacter pedis]|uniref:Leucine-rich repeat domain-containing protein n=1 Tax=Acanthopleuribacter pedis TaxID=442870 RepID=A0A8J7U774_9BACT|nr:leucine-rich repeat domain-containing protein [Acanthopleuribacter pedis]MBO1321111.1 leucine-rich repeat domain-containing protein [Acanthopleuribacter pedis]
MLVNHCSDPFRLGPLAFFTVWWLAHALSPAQTYEQQSYQTPDYRVGLHTHQGYPADMAALFDEELMRRRGARAGWAEADLDGLIQHAGRFGAPLLSHGGISWRIERDDLAITVVQHTPLQRHIGSPLQTHFTTGAEGLDFQLQFSSTPHAYSGGRFTLWMEDAAGRRTLVSQGWLNHDTQQADGRVPLEQPPAALYLEFQTGIAANERFSWTFTPREAKPTAAAGAMDKTPVRVPDRMFELFLLGKYDIDGDGTLTHDEVNQVVSASWSLRDVRDLTGLEAFRTLEDLSIRFENRTVRPIIFPDLKGRPLRRLTLQNTALAEPLQTPSGLTSLNLLLRGNTQAVDLRRSSRLTFLTLDDARETSPQPLLASQRFSALTLGGVVVDDPGAFERIKVTERAAFLRCVFPEILDFGGMQFSGQLHFEQSPLTNLRADVRGVTRLTLHGSSLSLHELQTILSDNAWDALINLDLARARLGDLPDFSALNQLEILTMAHAGLSGRLRPTLPPNLKKLALSENQITGIDFPQNTGLTELLLAGNNLQHRLNLKNLPELSLLNVSGNPALSRLDGLAFCQNLRTLYFRNCGFLVFPDLDLLPRLRRVFGRGNPFVDRCREADFFLDSPFWSIYSGERDPANTDLLCFPYERDDYPEYADRPLRSLSWVPQGDQWLLSWKGGTRRNFKPDRFSLTADQGWTRIAGEAYEMRRRVRLAESHADFQLTALAETEPDEPRPDQIAQEQFALEQQIVPWTYVIPHVPLDEHWSLDIELSHKLGRSVAVALEGVAPDGVVVLEKQFTIAPGQAWRESIDQLIEPLRRDVFHWVRLRADGELAAFQSLGRTGVAEKTREPLLPAYAREGLIHVPPESDVWFAGLVLVNPGSQAADVVLDHFDEGGDLLAQQTITLAPGRKWKTLAEHGFALQSGASSVRWRSSVPLRELLLYGNRDPFTRLFSEVQSDTALSRGQLDRADADTEITFINSDENPVLVRLVQVDNPDSARHLTLLPNGVQTVLLRDLYDNPSTGPLRFEADGFVAARALFFQSGKRARLLADMGSFAPVSD